MKVWIKTAHGYLSFQPPAGGDPNGAVTVQYRPTAGGWEEIDLEGLELPPAPEPTPPEPTPPEPGTDLPGGIPPSETAEYVGQIKSWLLSQGENLSGPCGAFTIVANVAWGCQTLGTGIGLLSKPDGNNCMAYSTDVVCYRDFPNGGARIVDVLGDAGGENNPMWMEKGPEENVEMDRWRPPINPDTVGPATAGRS
jgi:hypothetical protein